MTDQDSETEDKQHDGPRCWNCKTEHQFGDLAIVRSRDNIAEACPCCGFIYPVAPANEPRHFETVARSPKDVPSYELPADEVERRIPALGLIVDDEIREETRQLTANAPAYFWSVPASRSDYHNPLCRENHGLWAHTLMVVGAVHRLEESYREQDRISIEGHDLAISAAILHDQRKNGVQGDGNGSSTSTHAPDMARVIREESDLPHAVADAVETHMGPWYDDNEPESDLQHLVHNADMIASTANIDVRVPGPVPDELVELGLEEGDF